MGQFKPMVKMYTDEPSVILKLKKGGKVKAAGQDEGYKSMSQTSGGNPFAAAEKGKAPKKPSMAERRRAMNPNMYARGGKVAHKQMGGGMPVAGAGALGGMAPAGTGAAMRPMNRAAMSPMSREAIAQMAPAIRAARAAQVRKALSGMKKGGSTAADCAKLERELKHHAAMSASKAHGKASGGSIDSAETKTTLKNSVKPYAKTKVVTSKRDSSHGTGEVKEGKPAGYKMGGTIEGNEGPYENTKMVTAGKGKTNGTTGGVRMSNAGGYKHGGKAMKYADGGTIDSKLTRTTVEGGNWENRPANTSKPGKTNTKTGEVKEANAGGYKRGGSAAKKAYAMGGQVVDDGKASKMPGRPVSRPVANSLQSGTFAKGGKVGGYYSNLAKKMKEDPDKPNLRLVKTHTGPEGHVAKVYKDRDYGEHRVKFFSPDGKHLKSADYHTDDVSDANSTAMSQVNKGYKKGGAAKKYADGGNVPADVRDQLKSSEQNRAYKNWEKSEAEENRAMRESILGAPKRAYEAVKGMFSSDKPPPAGSVTKTEKSVTVNPGKKRGGLARC